MPTLTYTNALVGGAATSVASYVPGLLQYTVVDVATDSTTVSSVPAMLYGVYINTALSAHALPIQDNATAVITLPASAAAGTQYNYVSGVPFLTSLVVNPNDAATGNVTVVWAPL